MKHTFRGKLRASHFAFPAGLGAGYLLALFDKTHSFQFVSTIAASSTMIQLVAAAAILISAQWALKDFREHFQDFFSRYSLKMDSMKEQDEKRLADMDSAKQRIEAALQKLEKPAVQHGVQEVHEKLDELIRVLSRRSSNPNETVQQPQEPNPKRRRRRNRKQSNTVSESASVAPSKSDDWAPQLA